MTKPTTSATRRLSLDRNIERLRQQLASLAPFLGKKKEKPSMSLSEFDLETERLISDVLGETSELLEAYEYAEMGEASGLVNMTDEAPEGGGLDAERQSLLQRSRVLESCIGELEARRAETAKRSKAGTQAVIGPQVATHMSPEIRSVAAEATLRDAGQRMQEWRVGSLLVSDDRFYVGVITDTDLAREVVARGIDPAATAVKTLMRKPVTIDGERTIIDAVRLMKEQGTRHLAVTDNGEIIGILSVSNILRYYSGVV